MAVTHRPSDFVSAGVLGGMVLLIILALFTSLAIARPLRIDVTPAKTEPEGVGSLPIADADHAAGFDAYGGWLYAQQHASARW